jgi:nicotinamide riboside transporter PnuC
MNEQWGIALFGVIAITLSQDRNPERQRYACLFGLAGQPFWFYAAWTSQQWGIGLLTLLYTLAWSRGVWTQWIKHDDTKTGS